MAWGVLPMVMGFCLFFLSHGEENKSQTDLRKTKLVPVSTTGPGAIHQYEAAVLGLGLELKYQNPDIMLMNYRPRRRRNVEKKKKKHKAGAFSPLSMSQDGKTTHNSRSKRHGKSTSKNIKLLTTLLKHHKPHHEQIPPTKKNKVPKRKPVKKPQPPGVFSVLSYITQDKERSGGQIEDLDD